MQPAIVTCPVYRNSLVRPESLAISSDDMSMSYGELEMCIRGCARDLRSMGIGPADRIGVLASNSVDYAVLIFAASRVSAAVVPINVRLHQDLWTDCLTRADCKVLYVDDLRRDFASDSRCKYRVLGRGWNSTTPSLSGLNSVGDHRCLLDLESSVVFTSGSRGIPKGAILSLGNHYFSALSCGENARLMYDDCWLAVLPFYHVGGMAILYRCAATRCSVHIMSSFDVDRVNELIDGGIVTRVSLVPTMLSSLVAGRGRSRFPDTLRTILLGGEPIPGHLLEVIDELSIPVIVTYGMTETASHVCATAPGDTGEKLRSSGRALACSEIGIFDDEGRQVAGAVDGEIAVRGKVVFKRYIGEKAEDSHDLEGWFRTGDIGHFDSDGYLHVRGRKDDMFISGGENVYPIEIESVASGFEGVAECAVIAIEDAEWGRRPVLFFTRAGDSNVDVTGLEPFLRKFLPRIYMPRKIIEIDRFPRNSLGKVDVQRLRELFLQQTSRQRSDR